MNITSKEVFNGLSIEEQVIYINTQLENISLNKACESLGLSESTVRDRFKRNNYKRDGKKFIPLTTSTLTKVSPIEKKLKPKPIKKAESKDNNLDSIKLLEEKINTLESQIHDLYNIINTKNTININNNIKKYEGEKVSRNFKIDKDVQQRFKTYCKANSDCRIEDIISTILDEYLKSQDY